MTNEKNVLNVIKDPVLTFKQRFYTLAQVAENSIKPLKFSDKTQKYIDQDIIYDMGEGNAPFRARYCVPDYSKYLKEGSEFLDVEPPTNLWEAVSNLLCMYHNIPSPSGYPVYVGCLDELLEPFYEDEEQAKMAIKLLLKNLDSAFGDAFCHANLSGKDTKIGRIILDCSVEMQKPCPNLTMLYREDTPDDYALYAISAGLKCAKPSFANDKMYRADVGEYAVVSCYNVLPIGGNGLTLVRLNLNNLFKVASSEQELMDVLGDVVESVAEVIDVRTRYIIDECNYFENSYLYQEGFMKKEKDYMIGILGYVGLAECVNNLVGTDAKETRYGNCEKADALGQAIMNKLNDEMHKCSTKHCKLALHAQVGVMEDTESTPGGRIPVGDEPVLPVHIKHFARMHKHCIAGCGELYPFEETAAKNPQAVLDIIKGAFMLDTRYISFYTHNSDLIRVTGYLVKRSEIEKLRNGQQVTHSATVLGSGISKNLNLFDRKVRGNESE